MDADIFDFIKKYVANIVRNDPDLSQNSILKNNI
jgi:hypothetical protein